MNTLIRDRVEELHQHLNGCTSCATCEAADLARAVDDLLDEIEDAGPERVWTADEIRQVLAHHLVFPR